MHDPKSQELAEHFLADVRPDLETAEYAQHVTGLSQAIQDAVEAWFDSFERTRNAEAQTLGRA